MKISDLINDINETTSGGIAIVAQPIGKVIKRPNPSVFAKTKTKENTKDEQLPHCELCKGKGCDACGGTGEEDGYIHRDLGEQGPDYDASDIHRGDAITCKPCGGKGCEHCDYKGVHPKEETTDEAKNPDGHHHTSNEPFIDPDGPQDEGAYANYVMYVGPNGEQLGTEDYDGELEPDMMAQMASDEECKMLCDKHNIDYNDTIGCLKFDDGEATMQDGEELPDGTIAFYGGKDESVEEELNDLRKRAGLEVKERYKDVGVADTVKDQRGKEFQFDKSTKKFKSLDGEEAAVNTKLGKDLLRLRRNQMKKSTPSYNR